MNLTEAVNLLAHDRVWNADDWWTAALVPALPLVLLVPAAMTKKDWAEFRVAAAFLGSVTVAAYAVIWGIIGLCWVAGCL